MAFQSGFPADDEALYTDWIGWLVGQGGFVQSEASFTHGANSIRIDKSFSANYSPGSTVTWTQQPLTHSASGHKILVGRISNSGGMLEGCFSMQTYSGTTVTGTRPSGQPLGNAENVYVEDGISCYVSPNPSRYWMFSNGTQSHCVVEYENGAFTMMSTGSITPYGTGWQPGVYCTATLWARHYPYITLDYTNNFHAKPFGVYTNYTGDTANPAYSGQMTFTDAATAVRTVSMGVTHSSVDMATIRCSISKEASIYTLIERAFNGYNSRNILIPVELMYAGVGTSDWVPMGRIDNCAFTNLDHLDEPGIVLTDWFVFPLWSRATTASHGNSGNFALAFSTV